MPRGAKVLAIRHHRRRDGAGWRRLNVLVDNLTVDALAVAFAVGHVDVVILVDVTVVAVCRLVNRAGIVVGIVRVHGAIVIAVDRLINCAVANVRVEIAIGRVGGVGVCVLIDVCHRARIDIGILVYVGHRARILVDVGVC